MTSLKWTNNHMYRVGSTDDGFYLMKQGRSEIYFMKKLTGKFKKISNETWNTSTGNFSDN